MKIVKTLAKAAVLTYVIILGMVAGLLLFTNAMLHLI